MTPSFALVLLPSDSLDDSAAREDWSQTTRCQRDASEDHRQTVAHPQTGKWSAAGPSTSSSGEAPSNDADGKDRGDPKAKG